MENMPDILNSCRRVVQRAQHVHIDDGSLRKSAAGIDRQAISIPTHPHPLQIRGSRQACANFVLLCDCLNFCFWSDTPWVVTFAGTDWTRTFAMLAGLVRAIQADADWLNPQRWADVREAEVSEIFAGTGQIPLLRERVEVLHETGAVLISKYDGSFLNLVEEAGGQAPAVAELLARDFSSFRDVADYDGEPVAFLKRAQICAADLTSHWSAQGYGSLGGLDDLTVFADYRLPQLFRHWGTMRVTDSLYHRIEALDEIPAGSPEEVELRAATICISDRLAELLSVPAWRLDYFLWERSHDPAVVVRHHRTRTVFY